MKVFLVGVLVYRTGIDDWKWLFNLVFSIWARLDQIWGSWAILGFSSRQALKASLRHGDEFGKDLSFCDFVVAGDSWVAVAGVTESTSSCRGICRVPRK